MKAKNIRLIIILVLLIVANAFIWIWEPDYQQLNYQPDHFSVADTSLVKEVIISTPEKSNILSKSEDGKWQLNQQFSVDPNLRKVLLSVLNRVRIRRVLTNEELSQVKTGNALNVEVKGVKNKVFTVVGNPTQTKTYFIDLEQDKGYEVEIPGYSDFVGGIFQLNTDQWRDRRIFSGNWRTIQEISIDYTDPSMKDLAIKFEGDFFKVEGVSKLDSNRVVNYLDQFINFQANEMISLGRFDRYDSLMNSQPYAVIFLDDIKISDPIRLEVFQSIPRERINLVKLEENDFMVIDNRRINSILQIPEYFQYTSN